MAKESVMIGYWLTHGLTLVKTFLNQESMICRLIDVMGQDKLTEKIIKLLREDPGQSVKELAKKLGVNRIFLSGYLKALESQGCIRSKQIGPARVYFNRDGGRRRT